MYVGFETPWRGRNCGLFSRETSKVHIALTEEGGHKAGWLALGQTASAVLKTVFSHLFIVCLHGVLLGPLPNCHGKPEHCSRDWGGGV